MRIGKPAGASALETTRDGIQPSRKTEKKGKSTVENDTSDSGQRYATRDRLRANIGDPRSST